MSLSFIQFLVEAHKKESGYVLEYHDTLYPKIWSPTKKLKPKVRKGLLKIAYAFFDELKVKGYTIKDIYFTGSLANYNYTSKSDIDLHIVLDYEQKDGKKIGIDLYDMFETKKKLWGLQHDITIYDYPVELYVQAVGETLNATGIYSVLKGKWLVEPKHKDSLVKDVNSYAVSVKAAGYKRIIDRAINSKVTDIEYLRKIKNKLKTMRQSAVEKYGEFSVENLAFKKLRNDGYIEKLFDYTASVFDDNLSVEGIQNRNLNRLT